MRSPASILLLRPCLVALQLLATVAAGHEAATAIRKLSPGSGEKLLAEHLAFAPLPNLFPATDPADQLLGARDFGDAQVANPRSDQTEREHSPAFALHVENRSRSLFRRAAEVLAILEKRAACPSGTTSCSNIAAPNKCCQEGTYCTDVPDTDVGNVACCADGTTCGGGIGDCPPDATSCPAELGGGCCIPGYVCQGIGCVPSDSATPEPTTKPTSRTVTTTRTTVVEGQPSTVVVTEIVTRTSDSEPTTKTVTKTDSGSVTGGAPYRPTQASSTGRDDSSTTQGPSPSTSGDSGSQTGCPTGFYGCLATHGGGCCQTDRNCETHSCPPVSSATIISEGKTVVVAATDIPASASPTCASGWFMCGNDAGPVAGCCPSGYDCGTASCFSAQASQTEQVQKELPETGGSVTLGCWSSRDWFTLGVVVTLLSL